jgi:beta-glucosidase
VAYDAALASITLLRNEHGTLPLDLTKIRTIAVIGPDAQPAVVGGGGSSETMPFVSVSFLDGVAQRLGQKVNVLYARGIPSISTILWQTHFDGLTRQVFPNANCSGTPQSTSPASQIADWKLEDWPPAKEKRCVRWKGTYTPAREGPYTFLISAAGRDAYRLRVDGKNLLWRERSEDQTPRSVEASLRADIPINVELEYVPDTAVDRIGFGIKATDELVSNEAKTIAARADIAIVCVGFDPTTEAEGRDRSFDLPFGQAALIKAIGAVNPKTIVSVTSGGAYATADWFSSASALLQTWYAGQEGGHAFADVLFGHSPEGKLPISFELRWEDNPAHDNYYPQGGIPGPQPSVAYKEGVFVGYRYYTSMQKPDLFPFGFGLSYTSFRFSGVRVTPKAGNADSSFTVEFDVTNTGGRAGTEVAQIYVGAREPKVLRPVRELKGFQKVHLAPGQTQHVSLKLDRRSFSYFDAQSQSWKADAGSYRLQVGSSSVDLPLEAEVVLEKSAN